MSKYLEFISSKINKQENKEGLMVLGTALVAVVAAKHFIDKNESQEKIEDEYFLAEQQVDDEFKMELAGDFSYLDEPEPQIDPFSDFDE
mgnify:CR=1 FL=1